MPIVIDGTNGITNASWNTSGRPASPTTGQIGFNTTTGEFEGWTGSAWASIPMATSQGTSGQYLQSAGAAALPTWATIASTAGTLVKISYLTSGTSFTTQATTTKIYVELVGGGGGGGACNSSQAGGGSAGGYAAKYFSGVSPSTAYTYAIGAAGTAGTGTGAGGSGGPTSFTALGTTITGNGGNGGSGSAGSTAGGTVGGTATNGDINIQGGPGMAGMSVTPNQGGQGGAAAVFGNMTWNTGTTASYGSGGAGAQSSGSGGAGGAGVIRVWEYT